MDLPTMKELMEHVPFTMAATRAATSGVVMPQGINKTRVIESIVIALLTAGAVGMGGYLLAWPVLKAEVAQIRNDIREVREDIRMDKAEITQLRIDAARQGADINNLRGGGR